jgi:hypothetical protein
MNSGQRQDLWIIQRFLREASWPGTTMRSSQRDILERKGVTDGHQIYISQCRVDISLGNGGRAHKERCFIELSTYSAEPKTSSKDSQETTEQSYCIKSLPVELVSLQEDCSTCRLLIDTKFLMAIPRLLPYLLPLCRVTAVLKSTSQKASFRLHAPALVWRRR